VRKLRTIRFRLGLALIALAALPQPLLACATCFGVSDSDLAKGMNMGILSLLAVVVIVLGGIASFFIYLARRSAVLSSRAAHAAIPQSSKSLLSHDEFA
jgi:hypothetical protein